MHKSETKRKGKFPSHIANDDIFTFPSALKADCPASARRPTFQIFTGDARKIIVDLPQVHCVVTSPPYYEQRKYGDNPHEEIGRSTGVDDYIADLVGVFSGINLHPQGSVWVNLGDKRNKRRSLCCIPEQFVAAMRQAGFDLIDKVIWAKALVREDGTAVGSYAPEPSTERLNDKSYKSIYRFSKSAKPWADTQAVRIPRLNVAPARYLPKDLMSVETAINGRMLGNVWQVATARTQEDHYAVYPAALVERPVAMTCPLFVNPDGSLPRRIGERIGYDDGRGERSMGRTAVTSTAERTGRRDTGRVYTPTMPISLGWEPILEGAVPGIVLDPFAGTGTTGEVTLKLGRSFIGIELYADHAEVARRRCSDTVRYVEDEYGYDEVYRMITVDQSPLKAGAAPHSSSSGQHSQLASLFEEHGDSPAHLRRSDHAMGIADWLEI